MRAINVRTNHAHSVVSALSDPEPILDAFMFGLRLITFWQAIGLLALCRILFGGFGLGGGGHRNSRRRMDRRIHERIRERMAERWEQMTPEEREKFRQGMRSGSGGRTTPLDSQPSA